MVSRESQSTRAEYSVGFVLVDPFNPTKSATTHALKAGSPQYPESQKSKMTLQVEVSRCPNLQPVEKLVLPNCLIEEREPIPGLLVQNLSIQALKSSLEMARSKTTFLYHLSVITSQRFEGQYEVKSRKVQVSVNNCWRDLQSTEVQLGEPTRDNDWTCSSARRCEISFVPHELIAIKFRVVFEML